MSGKSDEMPASVGVVYSTVLILISASDNYVRVIKFINIKGIPFLYLFFRSEIIFTVKYCLRNPKSHLGT